MLRHFRWNQVMTGKKNEAAVRNSLRVQNSRCGEARSRGVGDFNCVLHSYVSPGALPWAKEKNRMEFEGSPGLPELWVGKLGCLFSARLQPSYQGLWRWGRRQFTKGSWGRFVFPTASLLPWLISLTWRNSALEGTAHGKPWGSSLPGDPQGNASGAPPGPALVR